MNTFIYSYPIKTFFGEGAARDNLPDLLAKYVTNVLLEYGKGCQPTEFILIGAVVTAFGTGAEQNNGAVITNTDKMLKAPPC